MRKLIGVAVACLLGGLLVGTTAYAAPAERGQRGHGLVLDRPATRPDSATLTGRAAGHRDVVLQKRRHGAWRDVRVLRVRDGRYRTEVGRSGHDQRFRTRAGHHTSRARTVAAKVKTPSDGCGAQPRKADGSYWSCTFVDDFNGTTLNRTKWVPQTIFSTGDALSGYACYDDDKSVVSVGGGTLNLSVRKNATALPCANGLPPTPYRAGMVSTYHLFSQQYGRFEARFKTTATTAPGLQESWWLWPDDRDPLAQLLWPLNGEIDIAETYSVYPDLGIPFLHYGESDNGGPIPGTNTSWSCAAPRGVFNTYTLEWTASRLEVLINGHTCLVNTSGDSAFRKHYILNLTQALGTGADAMTAATKVPAVMNVDYVKVWK
ncbi:glycoside hydrolase family 16 protein [Nocardioides halotolerans]|uniref:glycoside hydrolase family 16 protein n=1 Tax=Nocardioides halotolerans TaxID=433660 RepID=UPI0012F73937|nr:glycoside hydrolase family 16 protein [Nocardioides halotolerans]